MNEPLPDKMTGNDLVTQERYESGFEKDLHDKMDRVDRRDKRDQIITSTATRQYRDGYDRIWGNK